MADKNINKEEKVENKKEDTKKVMDSKKEDKIESKKEDKTENKTESKSDKKNDKKKTKIEPKELAVARGVSIRASPKYCFAICKMIKGKSPERAIQMLEEVVRGKRAVRMHGREVPHQKGKGVAGAKFPKKASIEMINIVKQLKANSEVNMIEEPFIAIAKADKAAQPFKRGGRRGKRAHVYLEAKSKISK